MIDRAVAGRAVHRVVQAVHRATETVVEIDLATVTKNGRALHAKRRPALPNRLRARDRHAVKKLRVETIVRVEASLVMRHRDLNNAPRDNPNQPHNVRRDQRRL